MRNWVPENQLLQKFADYPVIAIDLYGRERHPEWTSGEMNDTEDYSSRRARYEMMLKTLSYMPDGIPPPTRIVLIDVDHLDLTERIYVGAGTVVNSMYGQRWQSGAVIDLNGKFIQNTPSQRVNMEDEILSEIFGVPVGF